MASSQDGGGFSRPAKVRGDNSGQYVPLRVDEQGFLLTTSMGGPASSVVDVSDRSARLLGRVQVDNLPATQPISGTVDLGASSLAALEQTTVTVGNVVTTTALTNAELRAGSLDVRDLHRTPPASGTLQAVGSAVYLVLTDHDDLSSFAFHVYGHSTGTFVIERTLDPVGADPATIPASRWVAVGAFRAGTRSSRSTWVDQPGAFHGNCSASTALRVRVTTALNAPAECRIIAGGGTGTVTVGAIASNEGNVIGGVQSLAQLYATALGGRVAFNATTDLVTIGLTGEQPLAAFTNPSSSGVDIAVHKTFVGTTQTTALRRYRNAFLTGLGAAQPTVNRGGGANVGAGRLYPAGQYTRSGGTLGQVVFLATNAQNVDDVGGGIILRPGDSLSWTVTATGGLGGGYSAAIEVVWWELPAAT